MMQTVLYFLGYYDNDDVFVADPHTMIHVPEVDPCLYTPIKDYYRQYADLIVTITQRKSQHDVSNRVVYNQLLTKWPQKQTDGVLLVFLTLSMDCVFSLLSVN